jgi:hypothetical protein
MRKIIHQTWKPKILPGGSATSDGHWSKKWSLLASETTALGKQSETSLSVFPEDRRAQPSPSEPGRILIARFGLSPEKNLNPDDC